MALRGDLSTASQKRFSTYTVSPDELGAGHSDNAIGFELSNGTGPRTKLPEHGYLIRLVDYGSQVVVEQTLPYFKKTTVIIGIEQHARRSCAVGLTTTGHEYLDIGMDIK